MTADAMLTKGGTVRLHGTVLAASHDACPVVDGMVYFPRDCVSMAHLHPSPHTSACHRKGLCSYYGVVLTGPARNACRPAAAFSYEADGAPPVIAGRIAFYCGVEITDHLTGRARVVPGPAKEDRHCGMPGSDNPCGRRFLERGEVKSTWGTLAKRVPASVGGIALNLVALKPWSNVVASLWLGADSAPTVQPQSPALLFTNGSASLENTNTNNTISRADATLSMNTAAPLRILHVFLVSVSTTLIVLVLCKLFLAHRQLLKELHDPASCGAIGALLMACSQLSSETKHLGWRPGAQALLFLTGALQICLIPWFVFRIMKDRELPIPSAFPATVGVGMLTIASSTVGFMPFWWSMLGAVLSALCAFVFFPIVVTNVLRRASVSASPGIFILAAPFALLSLCHYSSFMRPVASANESCTATTATTAAATPSWPCLVSHALFVLSTAAVCLTLFAAWQRRTYIRKGFYRASYFAFIHHADAGVTFPLVAYSSSTMLYTLRVHGGNAFNAHASPPAVLVVWSWITVVLTSAIVGATDCMFVVHLPTWIRHGLPPTSVGQPEQCHEHRGAAWAEDEEDSDSMRRRRSSSSAEEEVEKKTAVAIPISARHDDVHQDEGIELSVKSDV